MQSIQSCRVRPLVLLAALVTLSLFMALSAGARTGPGEGPLPMEPKWYPPTEAGWPGAWLDPRDPAPYLAFHKAAAMRTTTALREEPTPNQALYDARYYALDLSLNPVTRTLTGTVTMSLTVTDGPLTQVDLDLADNLTVSSLTSAGVPTTFTHAGSILRVDLDRAYATGENATLVIQYAGDPEGTQIGFRWSRVDGQPMIWTSCEPFLARTWWPCKDYPDDKADSVDVRVTVPAGLITVSNGTLRQQSDDGTQAFSWWHESHPIATYLVSLASHTYHVYSDWYVPASGDSMEIQFYNYQSSIPEVEALQAKVKNMIGIFAARFGEYPFLDEKYGHAQYETVGMEHQTCSSIGLFDEAVVAHELAHQWWGDMVTCATFHDVWLNEGLATFGDAIYREGVDGPDAYLDQMLAVQYLGPGTIYVPDLDDPIRVFSPDLSYHRAAWVPHMLRGMMGDSVFFAALGEYRNRFAYRSATTEGFQAAMQDISGLDLGAFFQQWIYGEYYPIYRYSWTSAPAGGGWDVTLTVNQVQPWQLFTLPIEVAVTTAAGDRTFRVQDALASQVFTLHTDAEPTAVALDPHHWILRQILDPLPVPAWDRSLLLVNGCDWTSGGTELTTAYQDRSFTGSYPVDFWDVFDAPAGGYPASLPAPLGHGALTPEVMGHYKTVVWIGNNDNGDLEAWMDTPVYSYLLAGGNLLLLSRHGSQFLDPVLRSYLGISFLGTGNFFDCIATYPGLTNITRQGSQDQVSGFDTTVGPETTLLYKAVALHSPNWGVAAIRIPPAGGTYDAQGGRLAFFSGRPYRWNHASLRTNCEFILGNLLGVSPVTDAPEAAVPARLSLRCASPNPFSTTTALWFTLPTAAQTRVEVFDLAGRRVRTLLNAPASAGEHRILWNGGDESGRSVPSGIYFLRLQAGAETRGEQVLRVR